MDPLLQVQIDHLEQKFREIEPCTNVHPEAGALCNEALTNQLPRLREYNRTGSSQLATETLLDTWQTYRVIASRVAYAEQVRHVMDAALTRAASSLLAGQQQADSTI